MDDKILLVDDEKDIVDLLEEMLQKEGFHSIQKSYTGMSALNTCRDFQPDVIVLDIMLPDIDGLEVCKKIREFSYCSILFLSSKNDDIDKILGLSCGGDDYITKLFSPREVVFRIKAQLRRQQYQTTLSANDTVSLTVGSISIDKESCRAYKAGQEIELTGREFMLLSYLMENADKIISKERLYEQVWGEYSSICDNTIMVHIRHLREKIEDNPSVPQQLITVRGLGYKFKKRISGVLYGVFSTKAIKRLMTSIQEISVRSYLPVKEQGVFHELYDSLNTLDAEIRISDHLRTQTEKTREDWIANITHDLKTPLSPIRGYAEILQETDGGNREHRRHYADVMLKNISYMEKLIEDLKLTYQIENNMLPIHREDKNIVRFLKELVIDILNMPEYEARSIHFESEDETVIFPFDQILFTRAFRNLIINAFVHGEEHTEVTVSILASQAALEIKVADNGKGMSEDVVRHLFDRYYRGTNTEQKPEGTGLGLAIAKGIIDLHGGMISVSSIPAVGTAFQIEFLLS